ncbi:MAG: hypothetical protein ABIZ81_06270, partial [Opitutaceae bacterium]
IQVVDEEANVPVSQRDLKFFNQFFLNDGEIVAGSDPSRDGVFLFGREGRGGNLRAHRRESRASYNKARKGVPGSVPTGS